MPPKSAFSNNESKKEIDKIIKIEDTIDTEKNYFIKRVEIHLILGNFKNFW